MNKKLSNVISALTLIAVSMFTSSESLMCYVNAASTDEISYRTNCFNLYGNLNDDKYIDTFDVIEMRKLVIENEYSVLADLNHDEIVNADDLTLLSDYVLGKDVLFDAYFYDDADEDNVCDLFEVAWLKTNPDSADTDKDTISDYDEIVYSRTSPTNKYTRGLSVTDAEDDYDEDKLTNAEEIAAGTDSQSSDSDLDDINDYDEIKKYNTNPNDDDSDDDNISDGDELKLGLKPDNNKSDGEIPDNEKTFEQIISSDNTLFSNINTDESPYTVSIEINSAGIAEKFIAVHTGEFANASEDNRIKDKSVSFSYNENLKTESAKVYFTPKEAEKIENYMIFEYFPDTNYLLPVESKYTEDSVYTETSKLGTYCLVDISDENASSKKSVEIQSNEIIYNYKLDETEVAFLVDISGSLDETALEETKKSIRDFSQALFEHSENSYVTIIGYYQNPKSMDFTLPEQYKDSDGRAILNTIDSVNDALSGLTMDKINKNKNNYLLYPINLINNSGSTLFSSKCENKYVFILADSTYSFNSIYKNAITTTETNLLNSIHTKGINVNFIVSEENYNITNAVNNLKNVCDPLGFGVYAKSETGNFSVDSFARIYSDAIIDLKTVPIAYTSTLNANSIPADVERNAFINSLPKSYDRTKVPEADADGNIDFKDAAVKVGAAKLDKNGNLIFPSYYDVCDMSESTRLGYEQYMMNKAVSDKLLSGAIQIVPFSDKILYEDNDGDGIINKWDASPDIPIDSRFVAINDTSNYELEDLISDKYLEKIHEGEEMYASEIANPAIATINHNFSIVAAIYGQTTLSTPTLNGFKPFEFGSTPNGSIALMNFISNTGDEFIIDLSIPLALHKIQREAYYRQMNCLFDVCEQTVMSDNTYNFSSSTVSSDSWKKLWLVNYNTNMMDRAVNAQVVRDWWLTFGGAYNALTAKVKCHKNKDGALVYKADINYYIYDYYDWDGHILEKQHRYGLAKNFLTKGYYSFEIEWTKGKRFPKGVNEYFPIETTEFDGINDKDMLKESYKNGLEYYEIS